MNWQLWKSRPLVEYYYLCDCGVIVFGSKPIGGLCCLKCRKVMRAGRVKKPYLNWDDVFWAWKDKGVDPAYAAHKADMWLKRKDKKKEIQTNALL